MKTKKDILDIMTYDYSYSFSLMVPLDGFLIEPPLQKNRPSACFKRPIALIFLRAKLRSS